MEVKWVAIAIACTVLAGGAVGVAERHSAAQIEIAKIQQEKCK